MFKKIALYLKMIKFSHSIFALPFAFTAALMAASGIPSVKQILWIVVAMVSARSGAMGLNRIIDRKIDAANPRTANREIPSGKINVGSAVKKYGMSSRTRLLSWNTVKGNGKGRGRNTESNRNGFLSRRYLHIS